jgi:thioredoxin reductase (NADPH)
LKYYRRVADHFELDVHQYERVDRITGPDGAFQIFTTDRLGCSRVYTASKVVLATGYYDIPNLLGVPGETLDKVHHYYKEAHPYYGHDVVVVGGNNSAAIAALELYWTGARVTVVHRGPGISDKVKYWIKPNIENRIKNGEIAAYFRSRVLEIRPASVLISTEQGERELKNDFVFALIGYSPDLAFLGATGITLDPATERPRTDPLTLESERAGIYLAGVIVAGMHTNEIFIENGRFHGKLIADAIRKRIR